MGNFPRLFMRGGAKNSLTQTFTTSNFCDFSYRVCEWWRNHRICSLNMLQLLLTY